MCWLVEVSGHLDLVRVAAMSCWMILCLVRSISCYSIRLSIVLSKVSSGLPEKVHCVKSL